MGQIDEKEVVARFAAKSLFSETSIVREQYERVQGRVSGL